MPLAAGARTALIIGGNGFIGHHLVRRLLETTDWRVLVVDLAGDRLARWSGHPRFTLQQADMTAQPALLASMIARADVVLPLAAIAAPSSYIKRPLRVFELDFEANLAVVRMCVAEGRRVIIPSTSEVYGMCPDELFDPETSPLVLGPISKGRWIYSASKQLLDRVVWAYGQEANLPFTIFRPFNWIGTDLDDPFDPTEGRSRVISQFLGNIQRGEEIKLVDGGQQQRCFTDVADGVDALARILDDRSGITHHRIYNIGNPHNALSIRELAERMLSMARGYRHFREGAARARIVSVAAADYYGPGYQDMSRRVPSIEATERDLGWSPRIDIEASLAHLMAVYDARLGGRALGAQVPREARPFAEGEA